MTHKSLKHEKVEYSRYWIFKKSDDKLSVNWPKYIKNSVQNQIQKCSRTIIWTNLICHWLNQHHIPIPTYSFLQGKCPNPQMCNSKLNNSWMMPRLKKNAIYNVTLCIKKNAHLLQLWSKHHLFNSYLFSELICLAIFMTNSTKTEEEIFKMREFSALSVGGI